MPGPLRALAMPFFNHLLAADADLNPPLKPESMARFMGRWGLLNGVTESEAAQMLWQGLDVERPRNDVEPQSAPEQPVRLPAQWETIDSIILTWPTMYPPLWEQHAQMVEAITPAAKVIIIVPAPIWGGAAHLFLARRGKAQFDKIRFVNIPTNDIWVRDYGPIVGLNVQGEQVAVKAIFDPLPHYSQANDNAMALRWAAHAEVRAQKLDLHLEGGNLWSDGAGTIILSEQVYSSNPGLTYETLLEKMRRVFDFQKLIVTPRLKWEETGHVDLVVKLADTQTVLVSAPTVIYNAGQLRAVADVFRRETNAAGQPYRLLELPTPPFYLNWGVFPVWRSYTNALTVNGRVLVPVFGLDTDEQALAVYRQAMPNHVIIPIDSRIGANGGGTVHCLTKEIPQARSS